MTGKKNACKKKLLLILLTILVIGFFVPQNFTMPVEGAEKNSYNPLTFWYYPWGKSITHKGVDIFAKEGTNVMSSTIGIVVYAGQMGMGGNVVLILT